MNDRVSACRLWRCPQCRELLKKPSLGTVWQPGEPITRVAGTGTCLKCGASFPQSDIYGGRYDVDSEAAAAKPFETPSRVSVVVFNLMSRNPPSDVHGYCREVVCKKYARSSLDRYYIVGFMDNLAPGEALELCQAYVRSGKLPDLGRQFDSYEGSGPQGGRIVALFFRPD